MHSDEDDCISVQFLSCPFNRIIEGDKRFEEKDAYPPPLKPYFKGSNEEIDDGPTKWIRKRIASILLPKQVSGEHFSGNTHRSELHIHEKLLKELDTCILDKDYIRVDKDSFSSSPTFFRSSYVISTPSTNYALFQGSGFYNGDVFDFLQNPVDATFDIVYNFGLYYSQIEIDPPWPNKSVRRAKIYGESGNNKELDERLFHAFPVDKLCNDKCLFLVWITNDPRCITSVFNFFQEKNIEHLTTAYWIKTTVDGKPLVPLSSPSRETFERVVVGRWTKSITSEAKKIKVSLSATKDTLVHNVYQLSGKKRGETAPVCKHNCNLLPRVPLLVSTVSYHSRKPDCSGFTFLELKPGYRGLELFARGLRRDWYSVGDQCLLFQNDKILHFKFYVC